MGTFLSTNFNLKMEKRIVFTKKLKKNMKLDISKKY